jgi:hypothetical protein
MLSVTKANTSSHMPTDHHLSLHAEHQYNMYMQYVTIDMYTLDEGKRKVVGSGMGLFLSVGHWLKI